ncbi:alpha/beta hydrolase [Niabella insulamsoli]|uniref:alpha/beta hydrolase n=1 Tax=Niabella insulamsoli TaxID=3144874 RepID=UPI0031FD8B5A
METAAAPRLVMDTVTLQSKYLKREVAINLYLPNDIKDTARINLLLINDGQDLPVMGFEPMLTQLLADHRIEPVLAVGITAGTHRIQEYGIAAKKDYLGRGARAAQYTRFILNELIPFVKKTYNIPQFNEMAFAGFSLGGLSALDIVWSHPGVFSKVGVFSGSLWWRSVDQLDKKYDDNKHRIMQQRIRRGKYSPGLTFFFECGKLDESGDRNNNGIIDSIDDTLDHINELLKKGYKREDITYLELEDGRHDVATWGKAMPAFLQWGWGRD